MFTRIRRLVLPALAGALALLSVSSAFACVLSNQSSLSANGYTAVTNIGTSNTSPSFVPFIFQRVYGRSQTIRFAENLNELKKSLSSASLSHPFLWRWGDGTYSVALAPSHTYRKTGSYVINIYAFQSAEGGDAWSPFDQARVTIVPPGEVWRDNLGYTALDVIGFIMHWVFWIGATVLLVIIAYGFWEDWRKRHIAPRPAVAVKQTRAIPHP
jgi:hypothetical protein